MDTTEGTTRVRSAGPWSWRVRFSAGAGVFVAAVALSLGLALVRQPVITSAPTHRSTFWEAIRVDGAAAKWYDSLEEMTGDASVVVVGHMTSIDLGRTFNPEPEFGDRGGVHYLNLEFAVDEVLHGALEDPKASSLTVEYFVANLNVVPDALMPDDAMILFLINKSKHPSNLGMTADRLAKEVPFYEILGAQEQGRLTIGGGKVAASDAVAPDDFPSALSGRPVEEVKALVRAVP